jgi:IS5 family transposase
VLKLDRLIPWSKIRTKLSGIHKNDFNPQGGQNGYDHLSMLKAIILGQWHNLSDRELEHSLKVRIDFMLFTGLELGDSFPDASTLCRFRGALIQRGLEKEIFNWLNEELERLGFEIHQAHGAVVDATVIESAARPRRTFDRMPEDRKEPEEEPGKEGYQFSESEDPDARWLKEGKKCYFGYKGFMSVSEGEGFSQHVHVTSANRAESRELEQMISELDVDRVYGDKAYCSQSNRECIQGLTMKNGLMYKAVRGRPLSKWQRLFNRLVSKKRYIVEQCFGTLKRKFQLSRACYFGLPKVEGQCYFKATCFNLLKALNLTQKYGLID